MFFRYSFFSIVWAIIVLLLTLMPGRNMPSINYFFSFDKFAHCFVFAVQALLLIVAFTKQYSSQFFREKSVSLAILITAIYSVLIEFIQALIPDRSFEFADLIANTTGCFLGWGMFYLLYKA